MIHKNIKLGADPEFFLFDKDLKTYVSAHDIIPGSKHKPHKLSATTDIQPDGLAGEFGIKPGCSAEGFARNMKRALVDIRKAVPNRYNINFKPTVPFSQKVWKEVPKDAKRIGCDPSFNLEGNLHEIDVEAFSNSSLRYAGGHLHVGFTDGMDAKDPHYIKFCSIVVSKIDVSPLTSRSCRLRLHTPYAKPNFRPKSYGFELRQPDNTWVNYPMLWPVLYRYLNYQFKHIKRFGKSNETLTNAFSYLVTDTQTARTELFNHEQLMSLSEILHVEHVHKFIKDANESKITYL